MAGGHSAFSVVSPTPSLPRQSWLVSGQLTSFSAIGYILLTSAFPSFRTPSEFTINDNFKNHITALFQCMLVCHLLPAVLIARRAVCDAAPESHPRICSPQPLPDPTAAGWVSRKTDFKTHISMQVNWGHNQANKGYKLSVSSLHKLQVLHKLQLKKCHYWHQGSIQVSKYYRKHLNLHRSPPIWVKTSEVTCNFSYIHRNIKCQRHYRVNLNSFIYV